MVGREYSNVADRAALDDELIANAQAGDQAAFRTLFRRYYGLILAYALRLSAGNRADAEDLASEALSRAFASIHRYRIGKSGFGAWLRTIARNRSIDLFRERQARPRVAQDLFSFENMSAVHPTDRPDGDDDKALTSILVKAALYSLTKAHRDIIVTCYWGGHTIPEAATLLNLPLGTAKSRMYNAIRELRRRLPQELAAEFR